MQRAMPAAPTSCSATTIAVDPTHAAHCRKRIAQTKSPAQARDNCSARATPTLRRHARRRATATLTIVLSAPVERHCGNACRRHSQVLAAQWVAKTSSTPPTTLVLDVGARNSPRNFVAPRNRVAILHDETLDARRRPRNIHRRAMRDRRGKKFRRAQRVAMPPLHGDKHHANATADVAPKHNCVIARRPAIREYATANAHRKKFLWKAKYFAEHAAGHAPSGRRHSESRSFGPPDAVGAPSI